MTMHNDVAATYWQHPIQWTTQSAAAGTIVAGNLTGAPIVFLNSSAATPGSQQTRTAAQLIADGSLHLGYTWLLVIVNSVTTNTLTLTAGSGVTLTGAAQTVLPFSARVWSCTVTNTSTAAITMNALFSIGQVGGTALSSIA